MRTALHGAIFLALLISAQVSIAQNPPSILTMGPAATISCGTWMQERESFRRTGTATPRLVVMQTWVGGFLTGSNDSMFILSKKDFLEDSQVDGDAAFGWIDNYCRAQPLNTLYDASAALVTELEKKATFNNTVR